ncbi:hypothetical protein O181_122343 [Austropuccinia psidii MF-1]|uniref:Uncharacterized protein n=1 Tax=Austropuccinia psidii MF-1 TaxID=1389203 RepID=A0A9Q3KJ77_9BASI|nr:hypothetical protein [Austropuccinia psidii MF-1]
MGPRGQFISPQSQVGPNHKWADLIQFWRQKPINPKWPKTTLGPKFAKNHKMGINQCMASGNHQRPPAQSKDSPPAQRKTSLSSMHSVLKDQEWCIYGIIYHYALFLLRKPMMTLPRPNCVIPNGFPNASQISKEDLLAIQSGNSLAATGRPFEDPNHLGLQELGCQFSSGPF